ncbi:MAG: di-trans,poly-cis-decaprenylcistransferase [Crocinitomicaceae bacterium]|nr:di-trans,poly-cis-decaprenylcistransferase [Crocinitomicaceae bacterium]
MLLSKGINPNEMPKHIAIIMDGNGRWAKNRGENRVFGHLNGVESVRAVVEAALQTGVRYLTLYAFSTENWNRPKEEVAALMDLLVTTLVKETEDLKGKGVCLSTIGDIKELPKDCQVQLKSTAELNPEPHRLDLILALNYSSKWELTEAVKDIIRDGVSEDEVNSEMFESYLKTAGIPDPELMIRTSGEHRISNFMLWQLAYTEFHFTPVLWPDFRREHFLAAIYDFQNRERRFGGVPQQTDK